MLSGLNPSNFVRRIMSSPGYFEVQPVDASTLANDLASLGYPGFAYLNSKRGRFLK